MAVRYGFPVPLSALRTVFAWLALLLPSAAMPNPVHAVSPTWVLIDTTHEVARVMRGDNEVDEFRNISIGRGGVSRVHIEGDDTTPLGRYHITRVDRDSRFHVFLGLDYPTIRQLDEANRRGIVSTNRYGHLLDYVLAHGRLPQDSILGGHIGLHGLGEADPAIHARLNWTGGCVAFTDRQIDRLLTYVHVGTTVVIR